MKIIIAFFSLLWIFTSCNSNKTMVKNPSEKINSEINNKKEQIQIEDVKMVNNLQGSWNFQEIKGISKIDLNSSKNKPSFSISELKVNGNDGCNGFSSSIISIDEKAIKFSPFFGTAKLCFEMKIPDALTQQLSKISFYTINNDVLTFFDKNDEALLVLEKQ